MRQCARVGEFECVTVERAWCYVLLQVCLQCNARVIVSSSADSTVRVWEYSGTLLCAAN